MLAGSFTMFMVAGANVGLAVLLPVYAQGYLGLSPAQSGYSLLGFLVGSVVGATLGGRLTMRIVHVKRIALLGALASGIGLIALGLAVPQTSIVLLEVLLLVAGFGMGFTFPVTTVSVQNGVDQMHLGVATGMLAFLGVTRWRALGVAVLGAIALGFGVPLGADAPWAGRVAHFDDAAPFAVLFYVTAGDPARGRRGQHAADAAQGTARQCCPQRRCRWLSRSQSRRKHLA